MELRGKLFSASYCDPINKVQVVLFSSPKKAISKTFSNNEGYWFLEERRKYHHIEFSKPGYITKKIRNLNFRIVRLLENKLFLYQNKIWCRAGDYITAYVNSSTDFQARLIRKGLEEKQILDFGYQKRFLQSVPNKFFTETGLNWKKNFRYKIPSDLQSGLYVLEVKNEKKEKFSAPLVVYREPKKRNEKILVVVNTTTWLTYNLWGGRSRYRTFEIENRYKAISKILPDYQGANRLLKRETILDAEKIFTFFASLVPFKIKEKIKESVFGHQSKKEVASKHLSWKTKPISLKRPISCCNLEQENVLDNYTSHLAENEWRLIAWLDREKIKFDVIADIQLEKQDLLKKYKAVVIAGHSEYWSKKMFYNLKKYHEWHKSWIINLSGNTFHGLVKYTKKFQLQFIGMPLFSLIPRKDNFMNIKDYSKGSEDYSKCSHYRVIQKKHQFFENVRFQHGDQLGTKCLNKETQKNSEFYLPERSGLSIGLTGEGASGWETDNLANKQDKRFSLLAKGALTSGADMFFKKGTKEYGHIFSAGSITYIGSLLIDKEISTLTKNVIHQALRTN